MNEFLHSKNDTIFRSESNSSSKHHNKHMRLDTYISAYPEFSTALFAYSTYSRSHKVN